MQSEQSDAGAAIREGRAEDAASVATILRDTGWFEPLNTEPPEATTARVSASLMAALANDQNTLLLAEDAAGHALGYIFVHWLPNALLGSEGYISELFVLGSARGRGVGTALLGEVKRRAVERGCTRLMLFNRKMRESYQRGFYHKQGWVERDDAAMLMYYLNA
jgi:GNAT superfamily N-acetyltransferase